jgi:hypothetical protein
MLHFYRAVCQYRPLIGESKATDQAMDEHDISDPHHYTNPFILRHTHLTAEVKTIAWYGRVHNGND